MKPIHPAEYLKKENATSAMMPLLRQLKVIKGDRYLTMDNVRLFIYRQKYK
jgi:hypothetical protein